MAHKNKENWSIYKAKKTFSSRATNTQPSTSKSRKKKVPMIIPSLVETEERLADIFFNHNMSHITRREIAKMARFYQLLVKEQAHYNLTRLVRFQEIAIKHFMDCAIIRDLTPLSFPLLDLGSGAGFPGIILKILLPEQRIILAEGVQKKVDFLKKVRDDLELENLDILGKYVTKDFEYPVAGVITRAVEDMRNTLTNVSKSLQPGGYAFFMKGPGVDPEIKLVESNWGHLYKKVSDISYHLPKTPHQRRLIIYQKLSK
ncbi:MAG: 16S rRNA (guanine(527)-N(7))-methyltransferase RsmG [Bdellovibrionaceae bacterium]|nr:16S rRNA (guanine(527)-N(7))-methyltransferase RsmG [Pseudobdellovibrionaceae bacterium]MDW8190706.1 16S rRNA (guanine(527)-N(7))-methyltransferase RsmG [Pseudobdellovibrionaceae bacterium]